MDNFSNDVVEVYKYTFSQRGALTPTINYHRNMFYGLENVHGTIEVPTLLIWVCVLIQLIYYTIFNA